MDPIANDDKELFLIAGDDYDKIYQSKCFFSSFLKVQFFIIEDKKIIKNNEGYICSCGEMFCWHILKMLCTNEFISKCTYLDDFKETE